MALRPKREPGSISVTLGAQGRIVIPAPVRRELRLKGGDSLSITVEGGRLVLSRYDEVDERLWAKFARLRGTGVLAELRKERQRSAAREAGSAKEG